MTSGSFDTRLSEDGRVSVTQNLASVKPPVGEGAQEGTPVNESIDVTEVDA